MEKIKNLLKNKKVLIGLISGLVLLIALIVTIILIVTNQKLKLNKYMKKMGIEFYEQYYYDNIPAKTEEERKAFLAKYKDTGIKIDLENLIRYNSKEYTPIGEKFVNNKTKEKCNFTETKLVFYPKDPYNKKDYKLETILSCGFDK